MTAAATGSNPELTQEARQGLGKAALIVALLAVVLMVVFFFSLRQNIAALDSQVKGVTGAEEAVQTMENKVATLDSRVADLNSNVEDLSQAVDKLEGLPQEAKRMVYASMMDEMAQKADMLGKDLDEASKKKLAEVQKILKEVTSGM
ncbi:hypothetical protein [Desulfovermiculus halophilus]|jgi:archaellum component FlaC|uniref:hypothetical protein n=1 Tax=Desulfovermiculus halophilus TaxID=339722 RepID=UPI0004811B7F|nr:hypothetical protein [Desulfovermiculus halophilus]